MEPDLPAASSSTGPLDLSVHPVHLGLGASVEFLQGFDGSPGWYEQYVTSTAADGDDGRLVSYYRFTESWDVWEMHPNGSELVVCTEGSITLHQEFEGATTTVRLVAGEAAVNRPGVWHTADVTGPCAALFITSGRGTAHRGR